MDRMTLREAAARTYRSITTLRRYIRSGRLHAEKRYGRFGPEYFVSDKDLVAAGLDPSPGPRPPQALALTPARGRELAAEGPRPPVAADAVPIGLYQDLQMKHEQLLVQYGMVRAGGVRVLELRAELEAKQRELDESRERSSRLSERAERERARLKQGLREAQLELEGRALEISALREKVRALEMLTRNAVTNETIEKQFRAVRGQVRRIRRLEATEGPGASRWPERDDAQRTDH